MELEHATQTTTMDNIMPGFRFHPTEQELVGFYLRRKVEGKHNSYDLIPQLDLYVHDPWELPALSSTHDKQWFFFVPRESKLSTGGRPNRRTKSGYWKATGTDRMVQAGNSSECFGLKKTLVYYKGRAPKGSKTNWIMNEYRLSYRNGNPEAAKENLQLRLSTLGMLAKAMPVEGNVRAFIQLREGTKRLPFLQSSNIALCRIYKKCAPASTLVNASDQLMRQKSSLGQAAATTTKAVMPKRCAKLENISLPPTPEADTYIQGGQEATYNMHIPAASSYHGQDQGSSSADQQFETVLAQSSYAATSTSSCITSEPSKHQDQFQHDIVESKHALLYRDNCKLCMDARNASDDHYDNPTHYLQDLDLWSYCTDWLNPSTL